MMRKRRPKAHGSSTELSEVTEVLKLKREIGLTSAVSLIAGTMIGSGIFMSPEWVLRNIGSPGGSLIIWTACGLLATFGALSYAELGTLIKESGGEYIYILRNFGSFPAFLFIFTSVIVVRPASVAAVSLSFAEYAVAPFYPGCSSPRLAVKCTAMTCILLLTLVNCLSVKLATSVMNVFTVAKLLALLVIIVGGIVLLVQGHTQSFQNAFQNTNTGAGIIGIAFYQGLWSFDGWNNLNYVTEEIKKPEVNLPRAMMIAIPLVTLFYLLVNVSYFAAMTPVELLSSGGVAITWGHSIYGSCKVPHTFPCSHIHLTGVFHYGYTWKFQPNSEPFQIKKPELPRSYKVPIIIPVVFLLTSTYLVLAPIIDQPQIEFLYIILFILSGVIFYFPLVRYKYHPAYLQKLTLHLQLLLDVAPAEKDID
ncbi:hypothetical protein JD844_023724 [Phrynosoma platyrhinos]|uniref:B(0,+)-type amino acid transporter 1 n=1 Tax=Phrynosoma platyrhinos TaxID=52577 RepID=A0ABQ7SXB2_PHRPL|nr:hypothetical protein JD844_023724 [Phrynosoma platyrhinos]